MRTCLYRKQLWREVLSASGGGSPNVNVIITTYEMLIAATSMLTHRTYGYVILDEAQRIKNETTLIGQAVRRCRSVNKLLITGTPLQNDMHELWALLNFMFPDVFADSGQFDMAFHRSIGGTSIDLDLVCAAHKLLEPLMIRRLKRDVQSHLPKKTVLTIWCPLAPMQKFFYRRCLEGSGCASDLMMTGPGPSAICAGILHRSDKSTLQCMRGDEAVHVFMNEALTLAQVKIQPLRARSHKRPREISS